MPKEIDIDNIEQTNRSIPRNKRIAEIFNEFGLIEGWGTGLLRIIHKTQEYGLQSPEFKHHQGAFIIKFIKSNVTDNVTDDVTDNRIDRLISLIKGNKHITTSSLAEKLSSSRRTIARDIDKLKKQKILKRIGSDKEGFWEIVG